MKKCKKIRKKVARYSKKVSACVRPYTKKCYDKSIILEILGKLYKSCSKKRLR